MPLLQQLVDMLDVVQRAVEVEDDLRHDTKLLAHLAAEFAAQRPVVCCGFPIKVSQVPWKKRGPVTLSL